MIVTIQQMLRKSIAVLFFVLLAANVRGQNHKVTSLSIQEIHALLETMVNFSPDSTQILLDLAAEKIEKLEDKELAAKYWAENNLHRADYLTYLRNEEAKYFLENAYNYYSTHPDDAKMAEVFILKAQRIKMENELDIETIKESMRYFDEALFYAKKSESPELLAFIYYEKAFNLQHLERWQESIENSFLSLQQAEKSNDSLTLAAGNYLMGRTYNYFGFPNNAEFYLEKAIGYAKGMYQIASLINFYGDILILNNKTELAITQYKLAIEGFIKQNNQSNIIDIYAKIGQAQIKSANLEQAEKCYEAMMNISESAEINGPRATVFAAQIYQQWGERAKTIESLHYFDKHYHSNMNKAQNIDMYKDVAEIYSGLNLPQESSRFYKKWGMLKDSLHTNSSKSQLSELEKMYLKERDKNLEITKANLELKSSRTQQAWLAASLILLVMIGGIFIYFIRMRGLKENQALKFQMKAKQMEQFIETQESERQRLARELHDGIGQSLAALKMQLQFDDNSQANDVTVKRVDDLCREVRSLSHQMMPLVLKENGLKAAIEQLVEQAFANAHLEVDVVTHGVDGRLADNVEVHLYRVTQELFTNILKHANATKVGVQLMQRNKNILLIVEDNGNGFSKEQKQEGMGFSNIRSRIESLEGSLKVQSSASEGTYVRISVPISAQSVRKIA